MWSSHGQHTSTRGKRHTLTFCTSNVAAEPVSTLLCKSTNEKVFVLTTETVLILRVTPAMVRTPVSNDWILVKLVGFPLK